LHGPGALQPSAPFPYELLLSDTQTGRLLRSTDWASTPLGPVEGWPRSLRIAVGICLNSRFPMFVWWGAELINIYNDAYIPVLGKRHPDAFGRSAPTIWGEIWPVVGPQAEAVMKHGEATWNERVLLVMERHGYTEDTWFTWSYSPIPDDRGAIGGVFCACTEDTPRVLVERERDVLLHEIEFERKRLAEAFAQSPAFLAILRGPSHVFEYMNARYLDLIGGRQVIGTPVREALPEIEGQGFFETLDRVYASGQAFVGMGMRLLVRRGQPDAPLEEAYVDFVYQPMRGEDDLVTGILVHGVEVTAQVRAQKTLRESEARFRQLADAMPQIVFTAQPDGHVDYYNHRWYEYTGIRDATPAESWPKVLTEEWLARVEKRWRDALESGEPYEIECPLRRHDGEYRWHLGRAVPIRDDNGRIVRWFGTNTDIHERKQYEHEIQDAHAEAERASRMKDEFLATLSHELRTPLNAILGWAQILKLKAELPGDLAQGAEVIERNARAQGRIIEDLLDMSAILSGKVRLEDARIDLTELARSAIDTARPTAAAKSIALETSIDAPEATVRGDVHRLQQVLWNLLSNAIKFTPPRGRVEVSLRRRDGFWELCVADTGEGIEREFLPFMFDRFRQADATQARRHGGLGLGLSIVRQLVELHGGTVRAQSAGRGRGASFFVRLPAAAAPAALDTGKARAHSGPAPGSELAGLKVLVVDDDRDARDLVRRFLEDGSAQVTTASSATEAAGLVKNGHFDVLVSDIGMPGEDGHALLHRIRSLDAAHGGAIPAIALTAYARPEDRVKAVRAGFQMHLAKPVEPSELVAVVASVARRL
jgi:PAS domain S-box-containing protein